MFAARMRQYETIITINILLCIEIHSAANFKQTLCTFAATKKSLVRVSTTKLECSENNTDLTLLIYAFVFISYTSSTATCYKFFNKYHSM